MCVRHGILLILPTDHMVGGPQDVNAGWPANSRKGSLWTSNSQYYMPDTVPPYEQTKIQLRFISFKESSPDLLGLAYAKFVNFCLEAHQSFFYISVQIYYVSKHPLVNALNLCPVLWYRFGMF